MNALVGLRVSQCGKDSMSKEKEIEDFLKSLRDVATNVTDGPVSGLFAPPSPFRVVCMKCRSLNVEIIGESGGCGSEYTGSWPGSLTIKCRDCGAAESCNDVF